jgi:hypothetical protein
MNSLVALAHFSTTGGACGRVVATSYLVGGTGSGRPPTRMRFAVWYAGPTALTCGNAGPVDKKVAIR